MRLAQRYAFFFGAAFLSSVIAHSGRADSILGDLRADFSATTVPSNGDTSPRGVTLISCCFPYDGAAHQGDILVSNFSDKEGQQGTGTTIVRVTPLGTTSLFFQGWQGLGLTAALGTLSKGFVLVGNVPSQDGKCATLQPGSLLVIDKYGYGISDFHDPILLDGPWDMAIQDLGDHAKVFISNVLSGAVTRLDLLIPDDGEPLRVEQKTQIASGYLHRCDPGAFVVGPTGLAYDTVEDVLYVASTGDNAIFSIPHAGVRQTDAKLGMIVYDDPAHLRGPLALSLGPEGHLLISEDDSVIELSPDGRYISELFLNRVQRGAFGMALGVSDKKLHFAAVDDTTNFLQTYTVR